MLALQRKAGNRAVAGALRGGPGPAVVQRAPRGGATPRLGAGWERMAHGVYSVSDTYEALGSPIPPYPKGGDVQAALAAGRPGLLGVLTETELTQWQRAVDRSAAERELGRLVDALVAKSGSLITQQDAYKAWRRRADAALPPPGPEGRVLKIETGRFLDPDIMKIDFDVEAKKAFRLWAIQRLYAGGITLDLIDPEVQDLRFAQQMLPTDGRITADSLISIFPKEYRQQVSERPMLVQLRQLAGELQTIHAEVDPEFQNRVELNEKYSGGLAFVRKWSEWLGKGDAEMPDVAQWNGAYYLSLKPGAQFLQEGKFELAVPLLRQAYDQIPALAEQFRKYDYRYRTGALSSIKWLGRIKLAGSIAMTVIAGPEAGIWEAAGYAGAYAGAQSLAQQGMEEHLGQRSSIDLGAVAKDAAMASTMALIGMPLQAKMQGRILEAFVGGKALEEGVTATVLEKGLSNALAGMLSEVYLVPTQLVMGRVVSGQAFPSSVEELCGMIVEQALTSAVLTTVTDKLNAEVGKIRAERAAAGGAGLGEMPAGLAPRRSQEIGGHLLALGEKLATEGTDAAAAVKAASYDPVLGPKYDPARRADPGTEFGLTSPDAIVRVAKGVHELSGQPVPKAPNDAALIDRSAREIMKLVAKELATGMPEPKIKVEQHPDPDRWGSYNRETNTIFINANAKARIGNTLESAFEPMGDGYKRLLGHIYHEARHAEQTYVAMRVEAGRLVASLEAADPRKPQHRVLEEVARILQQKHQVKLEVVENALERRIAPDDTSPEARLGREVFEETFGTGRKDRDAAQAAMEKSHASQEQLKDLENAIGDLQKAGQSESEAFRQLVKDANDIKDGLARAHETYFRLAEEIDARRAGFSVESAFNLIVEGDAFLGLAKLRMDKAEQALATFSVRDERRPQLRRVFITARREYDLLRRLAALLPKPAAALK